MGRDHIRSQVQPPAHSGVNIDFRLLRVLFRQNKAGSKDRDSTASLGNMIQCLIVLIIFFPSYIQSQYPVFQFMTIAKGQNCFSDDLCHISSARQDFQLHIAHTGTALLVDLRKWLLPLLCVSATFLSKLVHVSIWINKYSGSERIKNATMNHILQWHHQHSSINVKMWPCFFFSP